jgi:predicted RNA-binding Zn-ribbon protein involved in translation (DUF1610 family)
MMQMDWNCPHCGWEERTGVSAIAVRLRGAGLLKREDERDAAVLLELAKAAANRLACPRCGGAGIGCQAAAEADDWDGPKKACAACGKSIPPERVALYPENDLCAACQERIDRGGSPNQHDDYCPRCGERMVVRAKRGAGVTRYEQVCPACRG